MVGPQGPQGPQGATGAAGADGADGADGLNGTFTYTLDGTILTIVNDTSADYTVVGTELIITT